MNNSIDLNQRSGCHANNTSIAVLDSFLFLTISIVASFGNIVVFICYYKFHSLRTVTNVFMLSLSASDLLVALFSIPLSFSLFVCEQADANLYYVGDMVPSILSIYSLALVAVDRAIAIAMPYFHQEKVSRKSAWISIGVTWVLLVSYALIGMHLFEKKTVQFTISVVFITYAFPVAVMVLSYAVMGFVAKKHAKELNKLDKTMTRFQKDQLNREKTAKLNNDKKLNNGEKNKENNGEIITENTQEFNSFTNQSVSTQILPGSTLSNTRHLRRELKAALTLSLILSCFIISWTPFFSLNTHVIIFKWQGINMMMVKYFKILHYANSALNPILYVVLNQRWRKSFKKVLCSWRDDRNSRFKHSFSEMGSSYSKPSSGW